MFAQTPTLPSAWLIAGRIALYLVLALAISLLSHRLAERILALRFFVPGRRFLSPDRRQTLVGLIGSLITLIAFVIALLAALALFVKADTLIWVVGLFSAAFGLGARSFVADVLAGGRFIFRNTFAIGEKVELTVGGTKIEGVVEEVNVTNTAIRSPTGELYVAPNGDITVIRNFSRAPFSAVRLHIAVRTEQLALARETLQAAGQEAADALSQLIEPWKVISTSDVVGNRIELTVTGQTPYAKAAGLKLDMAELIHRRLAEAGVEMLD